jgi:alkyl sulfatase BDS1-like metallo-beta-lactamase superfamily hydrolase
VRSVFSGNLGWFDGNPSTLEPLAPDEKAAKMAELAGGIDKLRDALAQAQNDGEHQWALELSDFVLRIDPDDDKAKQVRIGALLALGEAESNPNARHYYLTTALELDGKVDIQEYNNATDDMMKILPTRRFFDSLAVNLNSQSSLNLNQKVGFTFPDNGEHYTVWVRHGVAEIIDGLDDELDIHVIVDSLAWKKLLAKQTNIAVALARDFEFEKGGRIGFTRFLALFRPETS